MLIRNEISSFLTEMFKSMIVTFSLERGGGGDGTGRNPFLNLVSLCYMQHKNMGVGGT